MLEAEPAAAVVESFVPRLLEHHAQAAWLEPLALSLRLNRTLSLARREALLRAWVEAGAHADCVPALHYSLGGVLFESGDAEKRDEAIRLYTELSEQYPDQRWGQQAAGDLFRETRLQVGLEVPDFEAEDVDGVSFRLSDYRGKVVLLDFWGFW